MDDILLPDKQKKKATKPVKKTIVFLEGSAEFLLLENIKQKIKSKVEPPKTPDQLTQNEEEKFESAKQQAELAKMQAETDGLNAKTDGEKAITALQVFFVKYVIPIILASVLASIIGILLWQGHVPKEQRFDDNVLVALIHMGSFSLLGGVVVVAIKHLFPQDLKIKK